MVVAFDFTDARLRPFEAHSVDVAAVQREAFTHGGTAFDVNSVYSSPDTYKMQPHIIALADDDLRWKRGTARQL